MIVTLQEAATYCGDLSLSVDPAFEMLVQGVDAQVKDYVDRALEFGRTVEYPTPPSSVGRFHSALAMGDTQLSLREWPIAAIIEVAIDTSGQFGTGTVYDVSRFVLHPGSTPAHNWKLSWLDWNFPAVPGSVRVTYDAGYLVEDNTTYPSQPRMPANARLGTLKQIKLEYEGEGYVLLAETLGDHVQQFATSPVAGSIILDPTVQGMLRGLKSYV